MPFVYADRVRETSTSTGTGTFALAGAVTGFRTFASGIGANNTCYYTISHRTASEWEVGYGTLDSLGTTLTRTTVQSSSTGSAVVFSAGTKDVFVTIPASALSPISTPNSTGSALQALTLSPFGTSAGNTSELRLLELAANGSHYIGFKSPDSIASNLIWTLPSAQGPVNAILTNNGSGTLSWSQPPADFMGGRLTITTNWPYQSNIITAATLRYTPYASNLLYLWTGSNWVPYFLNTDLTITNSGTVANTNYDVSINWNSGTPTLVLTAWASSGAGTSTRSTAITYQDLIPMVGSNRYIGTVRTDGSNQFADWYESRFVWNAYNRVRKVLYRDAGFTTWTYGTAGVARYARNDAANIVKWITGLDGAAYIDLWLHCGASAATTTNAYCGIGMNGVNTVAPFYGNYRQGFCYLANTQNYMVANFFGALEIGYNFGAWWEAMTTAATVTFYGTNRAGISGTIEC